MENNYILNIKKMPKKKCNEDGCESLARDVKTGKCLKHGGGKRCTEPGCESFTECKTRKCIKHGGGKRCIEPGCDSSAIGKTKKCIIHGGGKRCGEPGCKSSAQGSENCIAHGGGKRCTELTCDKGAQGSTGKCIAHGGGKRCKEIGCESIMQGKSERCIEHGGNKDILCIDKDCLSIANVNSYFCKKHCGKNVLSLVNYTDESFCGDCSQPRTRKVSEDYPDKSDYLSISSISDNTTTNTTTFSISKTDTLLEICKNCIDHVDFFKNKYEKPIEIHVFLKINETMKEINVH